MNRKLYEALQSSPYSVAFTGAGVSTLSGIPDFRGAWPEELLQKFPPDVLKLYFSGLEELRPLEDAQSVLFPEKIFDLARFEEDPAFFYGAAASFIYNLDEKKPSLVHAALAGLEEKGLLKALITQNIDMLHQRAGSRRVIELHGSPALHYCLRCSGIRVGYAEASAAVRAGRMPLCPKCGRPLKPAITFYGEPLPLEARRAAETEAQNAALMLVLGTSLSVYPASEIPRAALRRGGRLVIVNRQNTPLDASAFLRFRDLEEVFA